MLKKWFEEEGLVQRAKELLTQSGVPLEIQVAQVCQSFIESNLLPGLDITSERVIYINSEGKSRELDRLVRLKAWVDLGEGKYWIHTLYIPIECKYRENLECIGFPYEDMAQTQAQYPIFGETGSRAMDNIQKVYPEIFHDEKMSYIRFLQFVIQKDKLSIQKIYTDDDHIYKAGAALYDYIKSRVLPLPTYTDKGVLDGLNLVNYQPLRGINKRNIHTKWKIYKEQIILAQNLDDHQKYEQAIGKMKTIFSSDIYLPIVCINSPLYMIKFDEAHQIQEFIPKSMLATGIVLSSWPEATPHYLTNPTNESLLLVTNHMQLFGILQEILAWYQKITKTIVQNRDDLHYVLLETHIYQHILDRIKDETIWPSLL